MIEIKEDELVLGERGSGGLAVTFVYKQKHEKLLTLAKVGIGSEWKGMRYRWRWSVRGKRESVE